MARRSKRDEPDPYVLRDSTHPARPNRLECLVCGGVHPLEYPIEMGVFARAIKAFAALHNGCWPTTTAARIELARRLLVDRRDHGTSSNAMAAFAAGGSFPADFPQDGCDLAACYRRLRRLTDVQRVRAAEALDKFKMRLGPAVVADVERYLADEQRELDALGGWKPNCATVGW